MLSSWLSEFENILEKVDENDADNIWLVLEESFVHNENPKYISQFFGPLKVRDIKEEIRSTVFRMNFGEEKNFGKLAI